MHKKYYFCLLALFVLVGCATTSEPLEIDAAKSIRKVEPIYPAAAKRNGVEGYVKLRFTLTAQGTVTDAVVTESKPEGVFDAAALNAINQFTYQPRMVNGFPQAITGMSYRFYFDRSSKTQRAQQTYRDSNTSRQNFVQLTPLESNEPIYPQTALDNSIEGYVTATFSVNAQGGVENIRVVNSTPSGVFDAASIEAIRKFKYAPQQARVDNVAHTFVFDAKKHLKNLIEKLKTKQ